MFSYVIFFVFVPLCQETLRATNRRLGLFFEGRKLMCKTPVDFIMTINEACFFFSAYFKFILYMHLVFLCVCC